MAGREEVLSVRYLRQGRETQFGYDCYIVEGEWCFTHHRYPLVSKREHPGCTTRVSCGDGPPRLLYGIVPIENIREYTGKADGEDVIDITALMGAVPGHVASVQGHIQRQLEQLRFRYTDPDIPGAPEHAAVLSFLRGIAAYVSELADATRKDAAAARPEGDNRHPVRLPPGSPSLPLLQALVRLVLQEGGPIADVSVSRQRMRELALPARDWWGRLRQIGLIAVPPSITVPGHATNVLRSTAAQAGQILAVYAFQSFSFEYEGRSGSAYLIFDIRRDRQRVYGFRVLWDPTNPSSAPEIA